MNKSHFFMGAFLKNTEEYVFPLHASKKCKYICPVCKDDVIFKSGKINRKHYSHKAKSDCCYYSHTNESEIHKNAKRLIKKFLDDKEKIMIWRNCKCCGDDFEVLSLNNYTDKMEAKEEYIFKHNSNKRIADVVLLEDGNINFIFEVFKTHRTDEIKRPTDNWCEMNAEELIINTMEQKNRNDDGEIEIECVRDIFCDECAKLKKLESDKKEADIKRRELFRIKRNMCEQEAMRRIGKNNCNVNWEVLRMIQRLTDSELELKLGSLNPKTAIGIWADEIYQNIKRQKEYEKQRQIIEKERQISLREEWDRKAKEDMERLAIFEEELNCRAIRLINEGKIKHLYKIHTAWWDKLQNLKKNIKKELLIWFPLNPPTNGLYKWAVRKTIKDKARANKKKRVSEFKKYGYIK